MRKFYPSQAFWAFGAALILMAVMALSSAPFASAQNLFNILRNASFIAIMALGMTPVLIAGGIDLSVGSVMALSAIAAGLVLQTGAPLAAGLLTGLAVGLLCGAINGALVAYARINAFIVTLAMLSAVRSLALVLSNGKSLYEFGPGADSFAWLGGGAWLGLPLPVWIGGGIFLSLAFALRWLRWGRYVYALGASPSAARAAGIPVAFLTFSTYLISGATASLAALLMTGWLGGVTNNLGTGYELNVIAAAVIGGVSLAGGAGGLGGPVAGALLLELIRNAFLMAGFNAYWQGFFVGTIILLAIALQKIKQRRS